MASILEVMEDEATPLSLLELPARTEAPFANRRSLPRVAGRFAVRTLGGERYDGVDLSFGGLMCLGDEPLWPGNTLSFSLDLPGEERPLHVVGRVVELVSFRGKVGMRVRFEQIDGPARKRIATWMSRTAQP